MRADARPAAGALLFLGLCWTLVLAPARPAGSETAEKRYPLSKAAELKAKLLDRPSTPEAASWATEYVTQPEIDRLDPVARAAERIWAARVGLAAEARGAEQKKLRQILSHLEECPLDSLALRRAGSGLVRIGVVIPLTGRFDRYGKTFVQGLRVAMEEHNREWAPNLTLILHDSEGDPLVGARKARWLLRDHGVSVIIGELFSANTAPLAAASQVVGAVLISPSATNERLAILGDAVFQLHLGNGVLAQALTRVLVKEMPKSSVGILVAGTPDDSARAAALLRFDPRDLLAAGEARGSARAPDPAAPRRHRRGAASHGLAQSARFRIRRSGPRRAQRGGPGGARGGDVFRDGLRADRGAARFL